MKTSDYVFEIPDISFGEETKDMFSRNSIENNKKISSLWKEIKDYTKTDSCYICHEKTESFCNSHHVPKFCISNIASSGEVLNMAYMLGFPNTYSIGKPVTGIKNSGTFHLICNKCDSYIFQDYENPDNYKSVPNQKMMSEIAMKDALKFIYKRSVENVIHSKMEIDVKAQIDSIDLAEYNDDYKYAERARKKSDKWNDYFYLGYYRKLDYVVPIAYHGIVALQFDLNDCVINNICSIDPKYRIQTIHISVLPLANETAIFVFNRNDLKRYTNFYKQLKKLSDDDILSIINFIIFAYAEDYFISPERQTVINDSGLKSLASKGSDIVISTDDSNFSISESEIMNIKKEHLNYSMRHSIPNLLSEEYKLR